MSYVELLPRDIPMRAKLMARLAKGGYMHVYANDDLGIQKTVRAETARDKPTVTYTLRQVEGQEWTDGRECLRVLNELRRAEAGATA